MAQNDLGYLYIDGKGVPKDEKIGVEWIRKAAEQGDANGQDSLGEMYRDGHGVLQDNVRAYVWFNLAVEQYLRQGGTSMESAQRRDACEAANTCTDRRNPATLAAVSGTAVQGVLSRDLPTCTFTAPPGNPHNAPISLTS